MLRTLILISILIFASACAGRLPPPTTAAKVTHHHFHKYAKKYPASVIGTHKVQEVQILNIEEIHKNLVAATCLLKFKDYPSLKVRSVLEKKSFGWKFVSWEGLFTQMGAD